MAATKTYNVVIEVGVGTAAIGAGKTRVASAFTDLENQAAVTGAKISKAFAQAEVAQERLVQAKNRTIAAEERAFQSVLKTQQMEERLAATQARRSQQNVTNIERERAARQREAQAYQTDLQSRASAIDKFFKQQEQFDFKLRTLDPFQSAQNVSPGQARSTFTNRNLANAQMNAFNNEIKNRDPFQNANNIPINDIKAFDAALKQNQGTMSQWGQAFKGAFIGAVAGIAFSTIIGGITSFIDLLKDSAVQAIKWAGDFESTTNALAVFAGSTATAREELEAIDKVALTTPGLTLENAEKGYQRLRALNFEAKQAKDLIEGLGTQRTLSGADADAVERVITNLVQLKSGAGTAADVRQTIGQLPTLLPIFEKAFGTQDFGKINRIFRDSPEAIGKFIEELAKAEKANGGFNISLENLQDTIIKAGREFGKPMLDPLTDSVKMLTSFLDANGKSWAGWGQNVADAIRGANNVVEGNKEPKSALEMSVNAASRNVVGGYLSATTGNLLKYSSLPGQLFGVYNKLREEGAVLRETEERNKPDATGKSWRGLDRLLSKNAADLKKERQQEAVERAEYLKANGDTEVQAIANQFKVEQAEREIQQRFTTQQEKAFAKATGDAEIKNLQAQRNKRESIFNEQLAISDLTQKEEIKLRADYAKDIEKIDTEIRIKEFENIKKTQDFESKTYEERRVASLEFKKLQIRDLEQQFGNRQFDLNREGERSTSTSVFDTQLAESNAYYKKLEAETRASYAIQLEDLRLSEEQKKNIAKESELEIQKIREDGRRAQIDIEERKSQKLIQIVTDTSKQFESLVSLVNSANGAFADFFDPSNFNQSGFDYVVSQLGLNGELDELKSQRSGQVNLRDVAVRNATKANGSGDILLAEKFKNDALTATSAIQQLDAQIERASKSSDLFADKFIALGKILGESYDFDKVRKELLDQRQGAEIVLLNDKILLNKELLRIEKDVNGGVDQYRIAQLAAEQKLLQGQQKALEVIQTIERQREQDNSTSGRKARAERLANGEPGEIGILKDRFDKNYWDGIAESYADIYELQYKIANSPYIDSLAIEKSYLQDILEIRSRETDAIIRGNKAKLEIGEQGKYSKNGADADFLEFLASQKGITEIVSDARIGAVTKAYESLDNVIGKLTDRFGMFGDVLKDVLGSLIKLALNKIFMKMFGLDAMAGAGYSTAGRGSSGGFSIPALFGGSGANGGSTVPFFGGSIFGGGGGQGGGASTGAIGNLSTIPDMLAGISSGSGTRADMLGAGTNGSSGGLGGILGKIGLGGQGGGLLGGFMSIAPLLGAGLGSQLGGSSALGGILGGLGGLGVGLFGAAALPVAIPLLIGSYLLGRNKQRRTDEATRNQLSLDSFASIDKLIAEVNADKTDGASAIEQAGTIRANYMQTAQGLKDKKTRNIALKDVSRVDAKIAALQAAADAQTARKIAEQLRQDQEEAKLNLYAPTFADGGNVRNKAFGMMRGAGHKRSDNILNYFPAAGSYGRVSPSEFVFDADTTANVGYAEMQKMLETKGESYNQLRRMVQSPAYATGGASVPVTNPYYGQNGANQSGQQPINIEMQMNIGLALQQFVQLMSAYQTSPEGVQNVVNALVSFNEQNGANNLTQSFINQGNQQGNK